MASKFILFAVGNNSSPSAEKQEKRYDYETGSSHPFKYNSPIHLPVRQVRVLFQLQCKYTIQPIVLLPPARTHPPPHSLNTHICWWLLGVPGTISTVTSSSLAMWDPRAETSPSGSGGSVIVPENYYYHSTGSGSSANVKRNMGTIEHRPEVRENEPLTRYVTPPLPSPPKQPSALGKFNGGDSKTIKE